MLDKRYDFAVIEPRLAEAWETAGCFDAKGNGREPYAIMMPPPNVTGTLHIGHALDNTLPDILVRRARMQGKDAVYQPGTDHASIAVHVILERQWAKEGKTRFDFGREAFLEKAWAWKDHSAGVITGQLRRLGISCDWSNERFTMDPAYVKAVNMAFAALYEKGLIYRGQRLVNWDPKMQTAVSDLEVKHKEVQGHLWHVRYLFADGGSYQGENGIEIATTRPETILADGAIAIHPADPRAVELVGRKVLVPLVEREISIVADEMVDPEFGSGLVKITAAHDFNDFAFYQRHKDTVDIPLINLMTADAKMNDQVPEAYRGMDRFEARKKIVTDLDAVGLLIKTESHLHNVGHAERDDTVLEPYLTWQWYVKAGPIAKRCLEAAEKGEISFVNERDAKVYRHWLENIQDWCISRQLWWGHRIPAWYRDVPGQAEPEIKVGENPPPGEGWRQDEDILDTWFSSGLWPFATQGWPQGGERLGLYYPGTVVMSGRDILFFWLVRMMMMGLELTDRVPFRVIYTHGLILDEHGQKMSKSKGNVVDPLELIEAYGADALRLTMASICSSEDMRFSLSKVEQQRNFCTKLWNAARFMMMNEVQHMAEAELAFDPAKLKAPVNRWLMGEMQRTFAMLDGHLDRYEFNQAAQLMYHFVWGTWCDWYLELTKPLLAGGGAVADETKAMLGWGFDKVLKALHPFVPFVTEEIWQQLTVAQNGAYLMNQQWPAYAKWPSDTEAAMAVGRMIAVVTAVRQARMLHNLSNKSEIELFTRPENERWVGELSASLPFLKSMAGVSGIKFRDFAAGKGEAVVVVEGIELVLPLAGLIDLEAERQRLIKEREKYSAELLKLSGMLGNEDFVSRAPAVLVEQNRMRQHELEENLQKIRALLESAYA